MAEVSRIGQASPAAPSLVEPAFAKINLTLRVLGKRADGYHELESLVCFASIGDRVTFRPGPLLLLRVSGPTAAQAGAVNDNLVMKAARALAARVAGLELGRFALLKRLPAGAGLGGGSADAGAALRLLARANGLDLADARVQEAARATGADVPVCLDPKPRWMRGIGDVLSEQMALPKLPALLVHPGVTQSTKEVFAALGAGAIAKRSADGAPAAIDRNSLLEFLAREANDLELPATKLAPAIADVLAALRAQPGLQLARMSGSGSACFGLFQSRATALTAARALVAAQPGWWIKLGAIG